MTCAYNRAATLRALAALVRAAPAAIRGGGGARGGGGGAAMSSSSGSGADSGDSSGAESGSEDDDRDGDDARVDALGAAWTGLFGEVCWVASPGFKHWPSIVFDPRWTSGPMRDMAMAHLGARHCCVYYGMGASERFTFAPPKNVVAWDEGLRRGYAGRAAAFKPRRYANAFPRAVADAREEVAKPWADRDGCVHREAGRGATPRPPPRRPAPPPGSDEDEEDEEDDGDEDASSSPDEDAEDVSSEDVASEDVASSSGGARRPVAAAGPSGRKRKNAASPPLETRAGRAAGGRAKKYRDAAPRRAPRARPRPSPAPIDLCTSSDDDAPRLSGSKRKAAAPAGDEDAAPRANPRAALPRRLQRLPAFLGSDDAAGARAASLEFFDRVHEFAHGGAPCPKARFAGWSVVLTDIASEPIKFVDGDGHVWRTRNDAARALGALAGGPSKFQTRFQKLSKTPYGARRALLLQEGGPRAPAPAAAPAPRPPPPEAAPVPEDAAGLVAALRTSTVGAKKNPRVAAVALLNIFKEQVEAIVADRALLADLAGLIEEATRDPSTDAKTADKLKRLKAKLKAARAEKQERDKAKAKAEARKAAEAPTPPAPAPRAASPPPSPAAEEAPPAPEPEVADEEEPAAPAAEDAPPAPAETATGAEPELDLEICAASETWSVFNTKAEKETADLRAALAAKAEAEAAAAAEIAALKAELAAKSDAAAAAEAELKAELAAKSDAAAAAEADLKAELAAKSDALAAKSDALAAKSDAAAAAEAKVAALEAKQATRDKAVRETAAVLGLRALRDKAAAPAPAARDVPREAAAGVAAADAPAPVPPPPPAVAPPARAPPAFASPPAAAGSLPFPCRYSPPPPARADRQFPPSHAPRPPVRQQHAPAYHAPRPRAPPPPAGFPEPFYCDPRYPPPPGAPGPSPFPSQRAPPPPPHVYAAAVDFSRVPPRDQDVVSFDGRRLRREPAPAPAPPPAAAGPSPFPRRYAPPPPRTDVFFGGQFLAPAPAPPPAAAGPLPFPCRYAPPPPGAVFPAPEEGSGHWFCWACEHQNTSSASRCASCGARAPPGGAPACPEWAAGASPAVADLAARAFAAAREAAAPPRRSPWRAAAAAPPPEKQDADPS